MTRPPDVILSGAKNLWPGAGRMLGNESAIRRDVTPSLRGVSVAGMAGAVLLGAAAAVAGLSHAQVARQPDILQLAAGGIPGVGLQIGYVDAGSAFTQEAVAYVNLSPRFASNRETLHVSAGVGGAIRILGTLETLTLIAPRAWDFHLGFRFGPGLRFAADETRSAKNQRFSLFLEPFVRFATVLRGRQTYFLEAGIQKPVLRLGVWFGI